jgi:hypothetical protein
MIANAICQLKTPKRGQSAQCPDRLVTQKRRIFPSNFLGVTPAPQYSLKVATNDSSVKPRRLLAIAIADCRATEGLENSAIGNRQLEIT